MSLVVILEVKSPRSSSRSGTGAGRRRAATSTAAASDGGGATEARELEAALQLDAARELEARSGGLERLDLLPPKSTSSTSVLSVAGRVVPLCHAREFLCLFEDTLKLRPKRFVRSTLFGITSNAPPPDKDTEVRIFCLNY